MGSRNVMVLNELDFEDVVSKSQVPVLVDFTAAWCGPCKAQAKILERIAAESRVLVAAVDVDESPALAARYGVRGMPTLLVFRGGRESARRLGLTSEAAIRALLEPSRRETLSELP